MLETTAARLLDLNREFYQRLAGPFSETRIRLQPGVLRALDTLPSEASVLDLGCGHGLLAAHLRAIEHRGVYLGVDSSPELLDMARARAEDGSYRFVQADLAISDWVDRLSQAMPSAAGEKTPRFDRIYAFATLHHLPASGRRTEWARRSRSLLASEGVLTLSVWNFLASPRLRSRIVPWSEIGLAESDLEEGDFLLDWRHGGEGLRYVHHFTEPELAALAAQAGFKIGAAYFSDGEGGRLGRYQVWEPSAEAVL